MQTDTDVFLRTYALFFAVLLARLLYCACTPIPLSFGCNLSHAFAIAAVPLLIAWMHVRPPRHPAVRILNAVVLFYIGVLGTAFVAQAVFFTGRGAAFIDDRLAAIDTALGFDWLAYMRFFDSNAWLDPFLEAAYRSIWLQPFVIAVGLAWRREALGLCSLLSAQMLGLMVAAAICAFAPALGAFHHFAVSAAAHPHIVLDDPAQWVRPILSLRNAVFEHYGKPETGLITFPSYHSMAAIFYIWYAWRLAALRWICLALNLTMLAATPLYGSHYFIDVIAGGALALVLIALVDRLLAGAGAMPRRRWRGGFVRTPLAPGAIAPTLATG